jgi:hypothetical protein
MEFDEDSSSDQGNLLEAFVSSAKHPQQHEATNKETTTLVNKSAIPAKLN